MTLGVRSRLIGWLILVLIPAIATGFLAVAEVEHSTAEQIAVDMANARRLEAARIDQVLRDYLLDAQNLAASADLVELLKVPATAPASESEEMQAAANALLRTSGLRGTRIVNLRLVDPLERVLGETSGFEWRPYDSAIVGTVLANGEPVFGNAFRNSVGTELLGMVAPVFGADGQVSAALVIEAELGPVVDRVVEHEAFGETSEAHIAQLNAEGDAEFITPLRFDKDAAFNRVVPAERNLPINQSLQSPGGQVTWDTDYRQTESVLAIETLPLTGWGLVVKVDAEEAFAPIGKLKRSLAIVGSACLLAIFAGWLILIKPISQRLRQTASAAARLAGGDYESLIDDNSRDEIGAVATSIDRLAQDLATDIQVRSEIESQLRQQATHDDLTGLCNRHHATDLLRILQAKSEGSGAIASLLFLDLDGFKQINDIYGHGVGDEVLKSVARRLNSITDDATTVARWGGDEFVLVLPGADEASSGSASERVRKVFDNPIASSAAEHQVGCSVGTATLYPDGSIDHLLTTADDNMFTEKQKRSKRGGVWPGTVRVVKKALETDRVAVWYQPLMAWSDGSLEIKGCEALARVHTEDGQFLPPAGFVGQVQNSELGLAIDRRVIEIATGQAGAWLGRNLVPQNFTTSVNLGESGMRDVEMADFILGQIRSNGLPQQNLIVDISEQASVVIGSVVRTLVQNGVAIAIDDVGITHSNVDRLLDVGASIAKIDRRWLTALDSEHENIRQKLVLEHLVQLCQALNIEVFAKGVETQAQFDAAHDLGVIAFQGHLFGPAMPAIEFEKFIKNPKWAFSKERPRNNSAFPD